MHDVYAFVLSIMTIDIVLLVFNILPIYPLDGGKILRSLLWFVLGRARSLMVATVLGIVGIVGFIGVALYLRSIWMGAISAFMLMNCWGGLKQARALLRREKLPRRQGFACPTCQIPPLLGAKWKCDLCGQLFDTFETRAACPSCAKQFPMTMCGDCGTGHRMSEWVVGGCAGPGVVNGVIPAK